MSVALIPMANELGWSTAQRGYVSAAFFWGYAATQIPAGYIATKVGGAKVLLLGVAVWSVGESRLHKCSCTSYLLLFGAAYSVSHLPVHALPLQPSRKPYNCRFDGCDSCGVA